MTRDIDDFLGGYKPPKVTVAIQQRADLLEEHGRLLRDRERAIRASNSLAGGATADISERISELEAEMEAATFEITFEALSSHQFLRLKAQHRPRKSDREQRLDFNLDTFPAALFASCAADPEMSDEQSVALVEKLTDGQFAKLWNACLVLNIGDDSVPKSATPFAPEATNGTSSTTAPSGGSLAASSSGE